MPYSEMDFHHIRKGISTLFGKGFPPYSERTIELRLIQKGTPDGSFTAGGGCRLPPRGLSCLAVLHLGVCEKKHSSGLEDTCENQLSKDQLWGWIEVSAAGRQGKGLHERTVFSQTPVSRDLPRPITMPMEQQTNKHNSTQTSKPTRKQTHQSTKSRCQWNRLSAHSAGSAIRRRAAVSRPPEASDVLVYIYIYIYIYHGQDSRVS